MRSISRHSWFDPPQIGHSSMPHPESSSIDLCRHCRRHNPEHCRSSREISAPCRWWSEPSQPLAIALQEPQKKRGRGTRADGLDHLDDSQPLPNSLGGSEMGPGTASAIDWQVGDGIGITIDAGRIIAVITSLYRLFCLVKWTPKYRCPIRVHSHPSYYRDIR